MSDDLDLTQPKEGPEPGNPSRLVMLLLVLVLLIGVAGLVVAWRRGGGGGERPEAALSPEAQKELALKLESRNLDAAAVRAWRAYLAHTPLPDDERAKIWYRIGKIQHQARRYEEALESFYTSRSLATLQDLDQEIAHRTAECLEALGKFAALRRERAEMGEGEAVAEGDTVAEIGPEKITEADLDRIIEAHVDRKLASRAAFMAPEDRRRARQKELKGYAGTRARFEALQQYIAQELLYRKAREDGIAEDPETRALLARGERNFLATRVVAAEIASQAKITRGDIENYYKTHKERFRVPERAQISRILVKDGEPAQQVLKRLKAGEKFEALAKELSLDDSTRKSGGEVAGWIYKGSPIRGLDASAEVAAAIFATEPGKVLPKTAKTRRGVYVLKVRAREPERQRDFEEVRDYALQAFQEQRAAEAERRLLSQLRERYEVVVHGGKFKLGKPGPNSKVRPAPAPPPARSPGK